MARYRTYCKAVRTSRRYNKSKLGNLVIAPRFTWNRKKYS